MIKKGKATTKSVRSTKKSQPVEEPEQQSSKSSYIYLAIIVVVIITAVVLMVMNKFKPQQAQQKQENQQQMAISDTDKLILRVGELIATKADEQPTVATVQDAELLKVDNPEFYRDAVNGDRLLIWSDKAVLYSTSQDRLLAVMPISQPETTDTPTSTEMITGNATTTEMDISALLSEEGAIIQVRNGTRVAGMAKKMSDYLKAHDLPVAVVSDAVMKDYATTTIYRLTTEPPMQATDQALKNVLGVEGISTDLPKEETTSGGDYVVIIGADYVE
ncbi:LytR C-terminal domain-containing protein [Patescibacteria group bacterium]|nr:LytR C-terminal domain-containing protein [Patescibacteria group bacterium]